MNKMMIRYMAEEGEAGGGVTEAPAATEAPAVADPAAGGGEKPDEAAGDEETAAGTDTPFLGGNKDDGEKKPDAGAEAGEKKPEGEEQKPATAEDYIAALKKDESIFGSKDLNFDKELVNAVIPTMQKHGIRPEVANELANAFAKSQMDQVQKAYKERVAYFQKMNADARAKYSDSDFDQINRGIDACFKKGGVMNKVIRNSELGCDPEFLALMYERGAAVKEDKGVGAAAGAGDLSDDPNSTEGLAKIWK